MYTLALAGFAPGLMMLLPPIHIPQAPLPLILAQTQPDSCGIWGRQAPGSQRLWGVPQAPGRKVTIYGRERSSHNNNYNKPTNRKWTVTLIQQCH